MRKLYYVLCPHVHPDYFNWLIVEDSPIQACCAVLPAIEKERLDDCKFSVYVQELPGQIYLSSDSRCIMNGTLCVNGPPLEVFTVELKAGFVTDVS